MRRVRDSRNVAPGASASLAYVMDGGEPMSDVSRAASRDVRIRARVLREMVSMVACHGYASTSVTGLAAASHISRSTFYRLFDDLQSCFECVIDDGYLESAAVLRAAGAEAKCWRDGVRAAFASRLGFFDANPDLARVLLIEVLAAGSWAIERRERNTAKLVAIVVDAWIPRGQVRMPHPMAVQAAMAAALGLMQNHVISRSDQPLLSLLGPLMGAVSAAFLDQDEVRREVEKADAMAARLIASAETHMRSDPLTLVRSHDVDALAAVGAPTRCARDPVGSVTGSGTCSISGGWEHVDDGVPWASLPVPALLLDPRALRARAALLYVQKSPHASNREIAAAAGIASSAQASALLGRLAHLGLIEKPSTRPGGVCSWVPTPYGEAVAQALHVAAQNEAASQSEDVLLARRDGDGKRQAPTVGRDQDIQGRRPSLAHSARRAGQKREPALRGSLDL